MKSIELESLVGKRIAAVEGADHPILRFDDGTAVQFEGMGYDGLWTAVIFYCPNAQSDG